MLEWRVVISLDHEAKLEGNAMTAEYYCEKPLSVDYDTSNRFRINLGPGWSRGFFLKLVIHPMAYKKKGLSIT